eukprot:CAMPEP_0184673268 /NCGR_PEP_ID=MMETSP0308-20130426/86582_1 /TAXON_ID=38269 /ORGANISM="Gloeochaete witrockiana, Strain SAG 46.84" /LENGTH=489 /DNA_ID=CAMNT_0027120735 /DNA_START=128 /DNA_END=1597 /DNA_ORIENTATION=+
MEKPVVPSSTTFAAAPAPKPPARVADPQKAADFVSFVNQAPSPFHAVDVSRKRLLENGFEPLSESDHWSLKPNGRYFFTRNQSTIVAFTVGGKYQPGNGMKIVAGHTDSPNLKVKPVSAVTKAGFLQLGVETYGGGLWYTWFDRDLTIAGRVIVSVSAGASSPPRFDHRLVHVTRPLMRISSLAIHLDREANEKFAPNKQSHLLPFLSTAIKGQLEKDSEDARHHPAFLRLLADELKCEPSDIVDFELSVCDTQPATIGGLCREFIFSPRIDNLLSCFCILQAFLDTLSSVPNDEYVRVIAMFDHEECGSDSTQGAGSTLMVDLLRRLARCLSEPNPSSPGLSDAFERVCRKSFLISADCAHACHPNYADKHEDRHRPKFHGGPVIKTNSNQRYATNSLTALTIRTLAQRHNIPVQDFVVRNDMGCGSTIGPILATNCGIRTVDIGNAQLSMHSIREVCAVDDVDYMAALLGAFFEEFQEVDRALCTNE